ncbi:MAG: DsrE family protein [Thermoanaerobaculia bacterium]
MKDTLVVIAREGMGSAEPALQKMLVGTWLTLVLEGGDLPGAICFYTDGVKLAVEGSPVLEQLARLEERGVHLIPCKTCLDFFGLAEKVRVGVVGGMGDILAAQTIATKVLSL